MAFFVGYLLRASFFKTTFNFIAIAIQLGTDVILTKIRSRRLFALKIGRTYRIPKLSVIEFLLTGQSTFPAGNPPLDVVCCGCSNGQHAC